MLPSMHEPAWRCVSPELPRPPAEPPKPDTEIPPQRDPPVHEPARHDPPAQPPDPHDPPAAPQGDPPQPLGPPEIVD